MRVFLGIWLILFIFSSCNTSNKTNEIQFALDQAGDNRIELEYVLDYYSKSKEDSLKLKAAEFLIRSLPFYHSVTGSELSLFKSTFDQAVGNGLEGKDALDWTLQLVESPRLNRLQRIRDIETITASFLIQNIEHSFRVWQEQPWGKDVSFEDFCEYILPYRIENEPLEAWKEMYYRRYQPVLDSLLETDKILDAATIIYDHIVKDPWAFVLEMPGPHLGSHYLYDRRMGSCRDRCDLAIYVMRSLGIPVGTDMVLHNPDQENRHFWSFVLDNVGRSFEFTLWEEPPAMEMEIGFEKRRGKVYRNDFSVKSRTLELRRNEENIPGLLGKINLRDVSSQYFTSNEVRFSKDELGGISTGIVYICVFSINGWYPIAWGDATEQPIIFENIEGNILYTLCARDSGTLKPIYYPFIVDDNNKIKYFKPSDNQSSMSIERKFTMKFMQQHMERFRGGRFEGSNDLTFSNPTILYTIDSIETPKFYRVDVESKQPFRYVRYYSPDHSLCNMAELSFYDLGGRKLTGMTIGSDGSIFNEERLTKQAVFDQDPLTFFNAPDIRGMWVGLDLKELMRIGKIEFLPRNDDNFIREGEEYELFYFNNLRWNSLGIKIGTESQVLTYDQVPENAIYWLRNLTKGKEERPFSYEDNKQVWW